MQRSIYIPESAAARIAARIAPGLVALALLLPFASCKKSAPPIPEGSMTFTLALPELYGGDYDPAVLAGKKVIVNFWSPK